MIWLCNVEELFGVFLFLMVDKLFVEIYWKFRFDLIGIFLWCFNFIVWEKDLI